MGLVNGQKSLLCQTKRASTVAPALIPIFARYGAPKRLHSDLGKEFVNRILKELCEHWSVVKSNTTAYHPQGNAYAKRIHRFFRQSVASYALNDPRIWDELLPTLILCYNDSHHSALGVTPAEVFLGRRLFQSSYGSVGDSLLNKDYTQLGFAAKLEYVLAKTHSLVFAKIQEKVLSNLRRSSKLNRGREITKYDPGNLVMVYKPVINPDSSYKISPHWFGPYEIERVSSEGKVYYLKDTFGDSLKFPISITRLKPYHSREGEVVQTQPFPDEVVELADQDSSLDEEEETVDLTTVHAEFNDPEEEYVPVRHPEQAPDEEERIVLQDLQSSSLPHRSLKICSSSRFTQATRRFKIPDPRGMSMVQKKRARQVQGT